MKIKKKKILEAFLLHSLHYIYITYNMRHAAF